MDPTLVQRAQRSEQQAFETLAVQVFPRLCRVALGVLHDRHSADDATRQVLVAMGGICPGYATRST